MVKKSLKKNQNNRKYKKQQQRQNKNKTRKNNNKNKNRNNKTKRNKSQKGSGLLTDIAVPVALVAAREVIAPMINRRMGKNNSKNKKLRGGFIRHHSTMPVQKDIQPSIMTVDEKINQSMD